MKIRDVVNKDHFLDPTDVINVVRHANATNDYVFDFEGIILTNQMAIDMLKKAFQDKEIEIVNL